MDVAAGAEALAVVVTEAEGTTGSLAAGSGIGIGVGAGAGGGTAVLSGRESGSVVGVADGATGSAQGLRVRIISSAMHAIVARSPLTTATT